MEYSGIQQEVRALAHRKNAVILAHNYQRGEVQEVADYVGDSLGLSKKAAQSDADIIIFCGVDFMAETVRIKHACHGATSTDLRQDHFPLRCQDVGGLRHEVHPTEDDDICVRLRRLLAQTQRISHIIRYFLDLTSLVVMGEYDGVLPVRQRPNLLLYS